MTLVRRLSEAALLALCACLGSAANGWLAAQVPVAVRPVLQPMAGKWSIEPQTSLVWWQMNPHFDHLWATSCPGDPFWMPGSANSGGFDIDFSRLPKEYRGPGKTLSPPDQIPLFPRKAVRSVCGQAVHGEVVMTDGASWDGITGSVLIDATSVITGNANRDNYMYAVIETGKYPTFSFRLDRLENVQPGDTLKATAVGVFTFRGIDRPVNVPLRAWRLGENKIRVKGKFMIDAQDLVNKYGMSKFKLGLGVTQGMWRELHMGFDLIFVPPVTG